MLQTEYSFTLPIGVVGANGEVHRDGTIRLATARDEMSPFAIQECGRTAYLTVLLLSRTVTRLGRPGTHHALGRGRTVYAPADFDHLQRLYERVNSDPDTTASVSCPNCSAEIDVDLRPLEDAWLEK